MGRTQMEATTARSCPCDGCLLSCQAGDVSIAPDVVVQGTDIDEQPKGEQQQVTTPASVTIRTGDGEEEATDNSGMVDVDVNEPKEGGDL